MKKWKVLILFVLLGIVMILILNYLFVNHQPKIFTSERWNSISEDKRYYMAKDLVEKKILIGKTRDEVLELLGENITESHQNNDGTDDISYFLGSLIGPEFLVLRFDENNIVIDSWVYID